MYGVIELLAVIASATYGVLLARRHNMDFVGVFSLAFIAAFGGGTLRDLFLDRHPLFWVREAHYPIIVFGLAVATTVFRRIPDTAERYLGLPDALGLGLFSVAGANAALDSGTSMFNASLFGVITGSFGGVIGDVICNRVPSLFRPAPLFATCSFAGCWLFFLLSAVPAAAPYSAPAAIAAIVVMRLAAIRYNLRLPHLGDRDTPAGASDGHDTESES